MVRMNGHEISEHVLAANRKTRLAWYDKEIEKRGKALSQIFIELEQDKLNPWLAEYPNMEAYLLDRWGMTPRRKQQLMQAHNVKEMLALEAPESASMLDSLNERQMREIVITPPEKRLEVLKAGMQAPKRTAKAFQQVREKITGKAPVIVDAVILPSTGPKCCEKCGQPLP